MTEHLSLSARLRRDDGIAMIVALMAMMLMMALGMTLMLTTTTESKIAYNYNGGTEALYAADSAVERVMDDILTVPDWNEILNGNVRSAFVDGAPTGVRTLPDGSKLDLDKATSMLDCGKASGCSDADLNVSTDERPWGMNNPRWKLYAYGPMTSMLPTVTINSSDYVVVWIADDPSETDNDPTKDGAPGQNCGNQDTSCSSNPGLGVMAMHAESFGPGGTHRVIEVTLARTDTTEIERGYTGQRGQDEQNRRARKAAVQTPGRGLTQKELSLTTGTIQ